MSASGQLCKGLTTTFALTLLQTQTCAAALAILSLGWVRQYLGCRRLASTQCLLATVIIRFICLCRGRSAEMPQDAIQALDVALKHAAMMSPILVPVARAFFNPGTARTLGAGAEVRHWFTPSYLPLV